MKSDIIADNNFTGEGEETVTADVSNIERDFGGYEGLSETVSQVAILAQLRREREERQQHPRARPYTFYGHEHPRAHDFLGIWLLKNEGWRRGIYVSEANIVFCRRDTEDLARKMSWEHLLAEGIILVCVGRGPFSKVPKVTPEVSLTYNTARFLGLVNDPVYREILEWSHQIEEKGPGDWRTWGGMLRLKSLAFLGKPLKVYQDAEDGFDARLSEIIDEQRAEKDLGGALQLNGVHNDQPIKILVVRSDSGMIVRVARRLYKPDVLVCLKTTSGQVLITARDGIQLGGVFNALLRTEREFLINPPDTCEVWVHKTDHKMSSLINGGWTAPTTPPTAIPLPRLTRVVVDALRARGEG